MLLVSQVAGALAAGLLVFALARHCGLSGRRGAAAVAAVSIVTAALLSLPNLRAAVAQFLDQRRENAVLTAEQKELAPGTAAGVDVSFLSWVEERVPENETFQVLVGPSPDSGASELTAQWILFQLAPRLGVPTATEADWVLFYEQTPSSYDRPEYRDLQVFKPGYAIARFAGAG